MEVVIGEDITISYILNDSIEAENFPVEISSDSLPYFIQKNFDSGKIVAKDRTTNPEHIFSKSIYYEYYYQDLSQSKWILEDKFKVINNMKCQLAHIEYEDSCTFYCWLYKESEIDIMPWKFPKIRGLAVEIYSEDRDIVFELSDGPTKSEIDVATYAVDSDTEADLDFISHETRIGNMEQSLIKIHEKVSKDLPEGATISPPEINFYCY